MQPEQPPTLYDRLGGVYNIATVVDDLIDRVMTDARLNKNPAVDEAHRHLAITEGEWAAFMDDLHQALAKFQVSGPEEQALVDIVESTHEAIVVTPPLQTGPPSP
jgi:hemoglobin